MGQAAVEGRPLSSNRTGTRWATTSIAGCARAINRAGSGDMIGVAMIDGRPYDPSSTTDKRIDLPRLLQMRLAPEVLQAARGFVDRYF